MDRGIPTEATLAQMRTGTAVGTCGTPKGRLSQLEAACWASPGSRSGRDRGEAAAADRDVYVLARSERRVAKERAMRRKQLKRLWQRCTSSRACG